MSKSSESLAERKQVSRISLVLISSDSSLSLLGEILHYCTSIVTAPLVETILGGLVWMGLRPRHCVI